MFTFRHEGNGVLTGVYLEHTSDESFPECCKRDPALTICDPFIGKFTTQYLQPKSSVYYDLEISKHGNTYDLHWSGSDSKGFEHWGKGIIIEGRLVGSYWN